MTLAATRLIALHKNKGMTVAACLKNRTDYIENPDKTEQGQFVSSYACSALTADEEFMLTKRQYDLVNGRRQKSDVIAYQTVSYTHLGWHNLPQKAARSSRSMWTH